MCYLGLNEICLFFFFFFFDRKVGSGLTEIFCKDCKDYGEHLLIFEEGSLPNQGMLRALHGRRCSSYVSCSHFIVSISLTLSSKIYSFLTPYVKSPLPIASIQSIEKVAQLREL